MFDVIKFWYNRYFTDAEAVALFILLMGGLIVLVTMGQLLAPVIAAVVIAYVLEWVIAWLVTFKLPRAAALSIVYLAFLGLLLLVVVGLLPLLIQQLTKLVNELPSMAAKVQELALRLPEHYPEHVTVDQIQQIIEDARSELAKLGQRLLTASLASGVAELKALILYLILVPLMVFFLLKDRDQIIAWFCSFLPDERGLMTRVWNEVHAQLGNFVRGKVGQIIIVSFVTYVVFALMHLHYAMLLAALVGVSVLIPYIGATIASVPIVFVAFFQFGFSTQFLYVMAAYVALLALDGNVLVPILFSEAVNLHPIAIIIAIIFFGGVWGFWGVFFAIPIAILLRAVIEAWPRPAE